MPQMTSVLGDRQLDHQQLCYRLIRAARSAASTQTSPATGDGIFFDTLTRSDCRVLDSLISHLQSDLASKTLHPTPLCVVSILTSLVWIPAAAFDGPNCRRADYTVAAAVTCAAQIIRRLENALVHCLHIVLAMHGAIWSDELHASSTASPREELIVSSLFVIAQYRVPRMFQLRDVDIFKCIAEYLLDHSDTSADASSREMAFRSLLNLVRRERLMMDSSWCWSYNDITALTLTELHRSVVSLTSGPSTGQLTTAVRAGELLDLLRGLVTRDDCWHLVPGVLTRCPAIMALVSEGMRGLSANKHHHRRSADPYFEASGRLYTGLWCLWSELCMRIRRQREPLSLPERPKTPSRHAQLHADPSAMAAWMDGSSCSVDDCRLVLSGTGSVKTANRLLLALYAPAKGIGVLAAPLNVVLKASRLWACKCYSGLVDALVSIKEWHSLEPMVKLVLRCLYSMLCTAPSPRKQSPPSELIQAVRLAGGSLQKLFVHVHWQDMSKVHRLSCSLSSAKASASSSATLTSRPPPQDGGGLDRISMEALVLYLLDRCRDHFQCVCLAEPANESSLTPLFIERCRVAIQCVEATSTSLFDGPIASREGPPVGLFAALGDALPRLAPQTTLPCSGIISYLDWVHSSFKALAPIIAQSSSISSGSAPPPHSLTTLTIFARQQSPLLVAAWQRIISAVAHSLSTPSGVYSDIPTVSRHAQRSDDQTPSKDGAESPHCSQQLQSCLSPSHAAEAVLDVCRRSVQLLSTLSSEAAAVFSRARAAVVEALWWLIRSTGCFGATLPAEDVRQLLGGGRREQLLLPCLDSCPTSVCGSLMLLTLSHLSSTSTGHHCFPLLHCALVNSVHSLAESNALPPLFAWLPIVFSAAATPDRSSSGRTGPLDRPSGGELVFIDVDFVREEPPLQQMEDEADRVNYVLSFASSVWQLSVQQLSTMTTPSSSELSSPQLLRTMCSGLRDLLAPPLVLLVFGGRGLHALLSIQGSGVASTKDSPSYSSRPLSDWLGLLSTWLDLEVFAMNRSSVARAAVLGGGWLSELLPARFETQRCSDDPPALRSPPPYELNILSALHSGQQQVLSCLRDALGSALLVRALFELVHKLVRQAALVDRHHHPMSALTAAGKAASSSALLSQHLLYLGQSCLLSGAFTTWHILKYMSHRGQSTDGLERCLEMTSSIMNQIIAVYQLGINARLTAGGNNTAATTHYRLPSVGRSPHDTVTAAVSSQGTFDDCMVESLLGIVLEVARTAIVVQQQQQLLGRVVASSLSSSIVRWMLAVLSAASMAVRCATNHTTRSSKSAAFRSAATCLQRGDRVRAAVVCFVRELSQLQLQLHVSSSSCSSSAMCDDLDRMLDDIKSCVRSAWSELGGDDCELDIIIVIPPNKSSDRHGHVDSVDDAARRDKNEAAVQLCATTLRDESPGLKRSFLNAAAVAKPVDSSKKSKRVDPPLVDARASHGGGGGGGGRGKYLKVSTPASDRLRLLDRGGSRSQCELYRARQGAVCPTYTAADRLNLNEQSQQVPSQSHCSSGGDLTGRSQTPHEGAVLSPSPRPDGLLAPRLDGLGLLAAGDKATDSHHHHHHMPTTNDEDFRDDINCTTNDDRIMIDGDHHDDRNMIDGDHHDDRIMINGDHHDDRIMINGDHHDDRIMIDGDHHDDRIMIDGDRHDERIIIDGDNHDDRNRIEGDRHDDIIMIDGDHHDDRNRIDGDHHDDRIMIDGDHHDDRIMIDGDHHDDRIMIDGDHHDDRNMINGDRHDERIMIDGDRHDERIMIDGDHHDDNRNRMEVASVISRTFLDGSEERAPCHSREVLSSIRCSLSDVIAQLHAHPHLSTHCDPPCSSEVHHHRDNESPSSCPSDVLDIIDQTHQVMGLLLRLVGRSSCGGVTGGHPNN